MPNCFSYVISLVIRKPESDWGYSTEFGTLPLVECPPNEATVVAKHDSYGYYHAAVVESRCPDGTPKTVKHRWGGGAPVEEVELDEIKPHSPTRRFVYLRGKEA